MKPSGIDKASPLTDILNRYTHNTPFVSFGSSLFTLFMAILLYVAWLNRSVLIWTPEHGLGYYLGIIGGVMMLLLLLYPLRKRIKWMGKLFPIKHWFQAHMMFGILGPVLIIMHSSYHLGSINGQVAFFSMLAVAISGLAGRYIYVKIHYGLYGAKVAYDEIKTDSHFLDLNMGLMFKVLPDAKERLINYETDVINSTDRTIKTNYIRRTALRLRGQKLYRKLREEFIHEFHKQAKAEKMSKSVYRKILKRNIKLLETHKSALLKMNELNFYEKLFSAWHMFHMPLFIALIITGFIHVYAVHVY